MNAMRHPKVATVCAGSHVRTARLTPVAAATPIVTHEKTTPHTNGACRGSVSTT